MHKKRIIFQVVFTLLLIVVIEGVSWGILKSRQQQVGFLLNLNYGRTVTGAAKMGFNEIDPLCGWALSNATLQSMGYETVNNCILLRSKGEFPVQPIKIFITGGSASDIALHKQNWPAKLHELLVKNRINAELYTGAVGGYSSGQELLKLMRDGIGLQPDIHLSYTGANDGDDGGYISDYEKDFYNTAYRQSITGTLLPNTVTLIKKIFRLGYYDLSIKQTATMQTFSFWKQNMKVMNGIARQNGHRFIGVLQPVLGAGNYHDAEMEAEYKWRVQGYRTYFPQAGKYITGDSVLHDFTHIFDTATGKVFVDDCHLTDPYQQVVAENVFKLLTDGGYIPVK